MELRQLEQLALFAKLGSISKVAQCVYLTQPSVTRSLRSLEDELGIRLFSRTKNKASLTEEGRQIAEIAQAVLEKKNEILSVAEEIQRRGTALIVGSVTPTIFFLNVPFLEKLKKEQRLIVEVKSEKEIVSGLANHLYDMGILSGRPHVAWEVFPLYDERLSIVLPENHKLLEAGEIRFRDLATQDIILYTDGGVWAEMVKKKVPSAKFVMQHDLEGYRVLAQNSNLPFFCSNRLFSSKGRHYPGKTWVDIADPSAILTYHIAIRKTAPRELRRLAAVISKEIRDYLHDQ